MKVTIIHGQSHKGSTYHIAHLLADKLGGEITEFFLPRDFNEHCTGCTCCFIHAAEQCPHFENLKPLTEALDQADVIILASPVYVYHVTGPMKGFLDHYGYRWLVHRPEESMFHKQAVCISSAAGGGMKSTNKDMAHSTFYWGMAKTYRYGVAVAATDWQKVDQKKKAKIQKHTARLAEKIKSRGSHVTPGIKTRLLFSIIRIPQKKGWNEADAAYWKEKGWTGKKRPWK